MMRRIFVGIDIPGAVKKRLCDKVEGMRHLPVVWTRPENYHITLCFLGYLEDEQLVDACSRLEEICADFEVFDVLMERIVVAPSSENPKMIWVMGESDDSFGLLQQSIEKAMGIFVREKKEYIPHITLGRIRKTKWRQLDEQPEVNIQTRLVVPVDAVTVYESTYENKKRAYIALEQCALN